MYSFASEQLEINLILQQNSLKDIPEGDIEITNNEYTLFFKQTSLFNSHQLNSRLLI